MIKKWTGLLAALLLMGSFSLESFALASLREQEAQEEAAASQTVQAEAESEAGAAQAQEEPASEETVSAEATAKTDDGEDSREPEAVQALSAAVPAEQAVLDNAALGEPVEPASQALDAVVDEVMDGIITDDMDTYDKVKACYDYVIANTSYGNHMAYMGTPIGSGTCWDVYQSYGDVEGFGAVAFTAGKGMCNAYASAFILMVRHLGLEARLVKGYTLGGGGGYAYHEWAEVDIGGTQYVFDPQLEQDLVKSGLPPYSVFCKTYSALGKRYQK